MSVQVGTLMLACAVTTGLALTAPVRGQDPAETPIVRTVGVIGSVNRVILRSEVERPVALLFVKPDGAVVKEGDLIVELDDSELLNEKAEYVIHVAKAEAQLRAAHQKLEIVKQQAAGQIQLAEQQLALAELDREQLIGEGGLLDVEKLQLDTQLQLAKEKLAATSKMLEKLPGEEQDSIQAIQIRLMQREAETAIRLADARRHLHDGAERKRRVAAANLAVQQAKFKLSSAKQKLAAERVAAEAAIQANEVELATARNLLASIERQIKACRLLAPRDGIVTHPRNRSGELLAPGVTIRERQSIVHLPDLSSFEVRMLVAEAYVDQIEVGAPAFVQVDAYPDQRFVAEVTEVGSFPIVRRGRNLGRSYQVVARLKKTESPLRIGMTAKVTIGE